MRKKKYKTELTVLVSQSTPRYLLLKDEVLKLYYIKKLRDNTMALIGDVEESYDFVLYGIEANKTDLKTLKFE